MTLPAILSLITFLVGLTFLINHWERQAQKQKRQSSQPKRIELDFHEKKIS